METRTILTKVYEWWRTKSKIKIRVGYPKPELIATKSSISDH